MKLRELYSRVIGRKVPGQIRKSQLLSRHERQLAKYVTTMGEGTINVTIQVFESGYVLYEEDRRFAVFHLDDIYGKNMIYDTVNCSLVSKRERVIPSEVYMNFHWSLRLILEGNERIMRNREKVERNHVEFLYSGISEDLPQLSFIPNFFYFIDEDTYHKKTKEVFDMIRNVIKPVQWNVYILIERDKKNRGRLLK